MKILTILLCLISVQVFAQVKSSQWTTTTNAATARTGLSVYSKAEVDADIAGGGSLNGSSLTNLLNANIAVRGTNIIITYATNATTGQITSTISLADPATIQSLNITNLVFQKLLPTSGHQNVLLINSDGTTGTNDVANFGIVAPKTNYLKFNFPRYISGTGTTIPNTNDFTASTFMVPLFSGTTVSNNNSISFAIRVPQDLDTNAIPVASLTVILASSDTSDELYSVGMSAVAGSNPPGTASSFVGLTILGDVAGVSGDLENVANVPLTSWQAALTIGVTAGNPSTWWLIQLQREGSNPIDASQLNTYFRELVIAYKTK